MTLAFLISVFVSVGLWRHLMVFYRLGALPYAQGYNMFSMIQWLGCALGFFHAFGFAWGLAAMAFALFLLQFVTHFTIGKLMIVAFQQDPRTPLALFSIAVPVTLLLGIGQIIWGERYV